MAQFVISNPFVSVGGTEISDNCESAVLEYSSEPQDNTNFGSGGFRSRLAGLKDWKLTVNINQDLANSAIDDILFPLVGTVVAIILKGVDTTTSSSNPKWTGNALFEGYTPLAGKVGEVARSPLTFSGSGALSRAESD